MNCGYVLADKWRYFQQRLKELSGNSSNTTIYMDGTSVPDTPERRIFEELGIKRYCCRKHLLTHVDLIETTK
jgi:DNA-directed RNA polymerase subunit N (RpoN/RPB10)